MREQIKEEMRDQGNMLHDQLQQFMLMFSGQHQVRISPNFPPKEQSEPILPRIGTSNRNAGSSKLEGDPTMVGENVLERSQEVPIHFPPLGIFQCLSWNCWCSRELNLDGGSGDARSDLESIKWQRIRGWP